MQLSNHNHTIDFSNNLEMVHWINLKTTSSLLIQQHVLLGNRIKKTHKALKT